MNDKLHYRKSWQWLALGIAAVCGLMLFNQTQEASVQGLWFFNVSMTLSLWLVWDQTIDKGIDTYDELVNKQNVAIAIYKMLTVFACYNGATGMAG